MKKIYKRNFLFLIAVLLWLISWNLPQQFYIVKGVLCILGFISFIMHAEYDPEDKIPTGF